MGPLSQQRGHNVGKPFLNNNLKYIHLHFGMRSKVTTSKKKPYMYDYMMICDLGLQQAMDNTEGETSMADAPAT